MAVQSSHGSSQPAATAHLSIHGIVQGVGFRDGLSRRALEHGLDGWVRNRRDGSVEAVVQGDVPAVEALIRWAQRGPSAARVARVDSRPASSDEAATVQPGFRCLPTV